MVPVILQVVRNNMFIWKKGKKNIHMQNLEGGEDRERKYVSMECRKKRLML